MGAENMETSTESLRVYSSSLPPSRKMKSAYTPRLCRCDQLAENPSKIEEVGLELLPRRDVHALRVGQYKIENTTPKSPHFPRDFARSCQHILATAYILANAMANVKPIAELD
jgi:uncharacterized Zn finger protein